MTEYLTLEEYEAAVERLYPADTPTGGVRSRMVAEELDRSRRQTAAQLRKLFEEDRIRKLGGLRGPTYAPLLDAE